MKIRGTQTNTLIVFWPTPATGRAPQQNCSFDFSAWTPPAERIAADGMDKFIIVNPPAGNRFYRLFKP